MTHHSPTWCPLCNQPITPLPVDTSQLRPKQAETLRVMTAFIVANGYPPSLGQLARKLGLKTASAAHRRIESLAQLGLVARGRVIRPLVAVTDDA